MNYISREEMAEYLNAIYDLERLMGKVSYKTANPRDLIAFKQFHCHAASHQNRFKGVALCGRNGREMDALEELTALIGESIVEEPPITIREGGMIKEGYNEDIDTLAHGQDGRKELAGGSGGQRREETGIRNLKISSTRCSATISR